MMRAWSGIVCATPSSPQRGSKGRGETRGSTPGGACRADEGGDAAANCNAPRLRSVRSLLPSLAPLIASLRSALLPAGEKWAQAAGVRLPISCVAEEGVSHPFAEW